MRGVDHRWDIVDAVARSPLLGEPKVEAGIDLAAVERALLVTDSLAAHDCERLVLAARELASMYRLLEEPATR